jgi:hypothetical protein
LTKVLGEACGYEIGSPLTARFLTNGHLGGNVDGGPAELCLVGDSDLNNRLGNDFPRYSSMVCGNTPSLILSPPTSFLKTAHTDEIYKMIPLPGRTDACGFALALANPEKMLALLREHPDEKAFDFLPVSEGGPSSTEIPARFRDYAAWKLLCGDGNCANMTNGDVLRKLEADSELSRFNQLAAEKLRDFKEMILAPAVRRRLPGCTPQFIDIPVLYTGKMKDHETMKTGSGMAIWAPAVNSLIVGDRVLQPDPMNASLRRHLDEQWQTVGLQVSNIDLFFAFKGFGALHCSTNVTRYCRPRN